MKRLDTRIQAEGAESLVLAHLLMGGITAYQARFNQKGFDIVAVGESTNRSARVQVKMNYYANQAKVIIKNLDIEFLAVVRMNRGSYKDKATTPETWGEPEVYIFPIKYIKKHHRPEAWQYVVWNHLPDKENYKNNIDQIKKYLKLL